MSSLNVQAKYHTQMIVITSVFLESTNRQRIIRYFFSIRDTYELQMWTIWHIFSLQSHCYELIPQKLQKKQQIQSIIM